MSEPAAPELTKDDVELHTGPPEFPTGAELDQDAHPPLAEAVEAAGDPEPVGEEPKLTTKKFALQAMLDKASAVVPSRDILPVLKNFLIEITEDRIRVAATDLELSIVVASNMVTVERPGTCVLPAKMMLAIVSEAADGDLTLDVKDGTASITCGNARWDVKIQSAAEFPPLPEEDATELSQVKRLDFLDALQTVRSAAGREAVRPNLMIVDVTGGKMRATDGVRFQQVEVAGLPDMQIPVNAVDDLVRILKSTEAATLGVGQDDMSLIFKVGLDEFVASKPTAQFPDVDATLLKPALVNDQMCTVDRDELSRAIKRVRITANPETSAVALNISKGKLEVSSRDKVGSTSREAITAAWDGQPRTVAFNHAHLTDLLATVDSKSVSLMLGTGTKQRPAPLLVQDKDQGLTAVLTQLRADWLLTE